MDLINGVNFEASFAGVDGSRRIHVVGALDRLVHYFSIMTVS